MERYYTNKQSAEEWLIKAWHNLSSARLLYDANHYTDIIAVELHDGIEKLLKSFLAQNQIF
ncbi:MAG: HEPN domain-containing protein [Verrucomicrobiota bacterium]|nr:HEPN domain-containing protein [Verrucomicrobiota bacterium]